MATSKGVRVESVTGKGFVGELSHRLSRDEVDRRNDGRDQKHSSYHTILDSLLAMMSLENARSKPGCQYRSHVVCDPAGQLTCKA
jgi:hypothetical protein